MILRHFVISAALAYSAFACSTSESDAVLAAGSQPGTAAAKEVTRLVDRVLAGVRSTRYVLGADQFDLSTGSYHLDCSGYVNHILSLSASTAYAEVKALSVRGRPLARHYYELFSALGRGDDGWERVRHTANLRPGDILAWKYSDDYKDEHDVVSTGHVMVVLAQPVRVGDSFDIRVSDSALHPHTNDSRPSGGSGVGAGTLRLDVDSAGEPEAFHETVNGKRETQAWIAAARPRR